MQGVDAVSQEVRTRWARSCAGWSPSPASAATLEDALDDAAERTGSADFAWAVMAIRIQREVGGNLAELLITVADTMIQRERLRRDVKSLTAEGRISAIVLGLLPPASVSSCTSSTRSTCRRCSTTRSGRSCWASAVVMMVVGFLWMRKIIQIDV